MLHQSGQQSQQNPSVHLLLGTEKQHLSLPKQSQSLSPATQVQLYLHAALWVHTQLLVG